MAVKYPNRESVPRGGSDQWDQGQASVVLLDDFFAAGIAYSGILKRWNGSSWVKEPLKVYNGSSWVAATLKVYDGADWVRVDTTGV